MAIEALDPNSAQFVSAISLAELTFGVRMAEAFGGASLPVLQQMMVEARRYAVLDVTHHTSAAYAELKTNLAKRYLAKANRRDRPRWLEEWVDKTSGQKLQVDENDLWMCAQVKERDLIFLSLLTIAWDGSKMLISMFDCSFCDARGLRVCCH